MNKKIAEALKKAKESLSVDSCFLCGGRIAHDDDCIMNEVDFFFKKERIRRLNNAKNILFNNGFTCHLDSDGKIYDVKRTEVAGGN